MTPAVLQPLFEQWRNENLSFCVTSKNYNKSNNLIEANSAGGGLFFRYPCHHLLESPESWEESNRWDKEPPKFLPQEQINEIAKLLITQFKPTTITLQVTTFCNYYCPMCPWHGKDNPYKTKYYSNNPELKNKNMPLEMAKMAVDKIVEYGITNIGLTPQGEFFLYPHWEELLEYTTKLGVSVSVTTNASLLDKETIKKLKNFNISILCASVDTLDFNLFQSIRGSNKKLFENTINAPFLIGELSNVYKQVNFVEQIQNHDEFDTILDTFKSANVNQIVKILETTFDDREQQSDRNSRYPILLCEDFGGCIIQVNGDIMACCYMASYPKALESKTQNIYINSLDDAIKAINSEFVESALNGLCYRCPSYRTRVIDKNTMNIYKGYFEITNARLKRYFSIPEKISMLPDDVLLYMYQNNLVTKMKQDGIL
ncbi:radical SAM protein [Helicobacter ganmani]|uniref:radical SAM protein n=1 Tax=Helicobacter ganmani TaxID=60246 RepID=UPI003A83B546